MMGKQPSILDDDLKIPLNKEASQMINPDFGINGF